LAGGTAAVSRIVEALLASRRIRDEHDRQQFSTLAEVVQHTWSRA
jgi:hypothetical protein